MDRRAAWVLGIIFGGLFFCLFGFLLLLFFALKPAGKSGLATGERVGIVEIVGPISDSKRALKDIQEFKDDDQVKAIVVRIDSPGGSVGPSQEIFDALRRLKVKKKVVVSMGSLAASGGFYIACAGDKVFANPGTLTGSIGVIMQVPNVSGVLKWAGVEMNTITAGKLKDSGSPFRSMSEEERQYFKSVLDDVHGQFIQAVAEGRQLPVEEVKPFADGRVFSGRQAKEYKLVDELGGIEDAIAAAGKLGGISGEPKIEYPRREKKFLRELLGTDDAESMFQGAAARAIEQLGGAGLQYRLPLVDGR